MFLILNVSCIDADVQQYFMCGFLYDIRCSRLTRLT